MTKIELFNHHDITFNCIDGKLKKEYLYMDKYRVFVDEIINNKELTYHKELEYHPRYKGNEMKAYLKKRLESVNETGNNR